MIKPLFAGNWKMHKTMEETKEFFNQLKGMLNDNIDADILVCPPFTSLHQGHLSIMDSFIKLGAQNCHYESKGAFTGEISVEMLKDLGCSYIIIGHSERRNIFKEDNDIINKKLKAVIRAGLIPVFCVGETLEEKQSDSTYKVIEQQLDEGLEGINDSKALVVAYEPVWAIGTGLAATPKDAEDVISYIRSKLGTIFGEEIRETTQILYGGSVNPENIKELMEQKNINGALIGGASLDPKDFYKIIMNGA
jgi:triosephosphate isomerase